MRDGPLVALAEEQHVPHAQALAKLEEPRLGGAGELSEAGLPAWLKLTYPVPESDCTM